MQRKCKCCCCPMVPSEANIVFIILSFSTVHRNNKTMPFLLLLLLHGKHECENKFFVTW